MIREVSDSTRLRRFCRLGLIERVPDESTVRKLTRRLAAEVVHPLTREVIQTARREKRFRPLGGADRLDRGRGRHSLTDRLGLTADGVRALAREGRELVALVGAKRTSVRARSRPAGRRLRAITRRMRRGSGTVERR